MWVAKMINSLDLVTLKAPCCSVYFKTVGGEVPPPKFPKMLRHACDKFVTLLSVSRETILITITFIQSESTDKLPVQLSILQTEVKIKVTVATIIKR